MKTIFVTLLIAISILTSITSNVLAAEEEILSYSLCRKNIEKVAMGSTSRGFYINIKLSDKATIDFAQLTEKNIGRKLKILLGEKIITEPIIRAAIYGGSIGASSMTESEAIELKEMVSNQAPEAPCGSIQ